MRQAGSQEGDPAPPWAVAQLDREGIDDGDVADHGRQTVVVHMVGELVVIEALRLRDRHDPHLTGRVAERNESVAQGIDALARRFRLVFAQHIAQPRKIERRSGCEALHDNDAIDQRTELHLDRHRQQANHRAAEHLA
jgi:hypothetical protein